jgi:hypothetical protein
MPDDDVQRPNSDGSLRVIDPVDDAIGPMPGAVTVGQRWSESSDDALRAIEKRPHDELVRRERRRLGQAVGKLTPSSGRDDQQIATGSLRHTERLRGSAIA